jgi:hypothetical protein
MGSRKTTTNPLRFRVERIGDQFVILDSVALKFDSFNSRAEAEQQCAARNGTAPSGKKSDWPTAIERQFRKTGVTMEDVDAFNEATERARGRLSQSELLRPLIDKQEQQAASDYRKWLPPMLRAWTNEVAVQCGGGTKRRSWDDGAVLRVIQLDGFDFHFSTQYLRDLHLKVWPIINEAAESNIEQRKLLCVHFLSPDPAHVKAAHFGVSRRTYLRQVDAALQWLAAHWLNGNYPASPWPDDEVSDDDDFDAHWGIDADDLANFRWQK